MANKVTQSFWLNGMGLAALMAGLLLLWDVGTWKVIVWLVVVNLWLLALLAKDKRAAMKGGSRTPELVLLALGFVGATPVLLLARKFLKHKTSKESFVAAVWGVVAVQAALVLYALTK